MVVKRGVTRPSLYPRAREPAVALRSRLFAAAAVLVGVGTRARRALDRRDRVPLLPARRRGLSPVAATRRARVLDREEKTPTGTERETRARTDEQRRRRSRRQPRPRSSTGSREARGAGADLVALPRARRHRLPARGSPAAARRSSARRGASVERDRRRDARDRRARRRARTSTPTSTTPASSSPDGEVRGVYRKRFLPNYGVFDENRYFASGRRPAAAPLRRRRSSAPTICEDIWQPGPPTTDLALAGAQLVINISASPFHVGKDREREEMLRVRARDNSCFIAYCNLVGGQDELIFDGALGRARRRGRARRARARASRRSCSSSTSTRWPRSGGGSATSGAARSPASARGRRRAGRARARARRGSRASSLRPQPADAARRPRADARSRSSSACATTSTKNGFGDVVIGLSGGIDSALTAAIAVGALGAERVHGVSMPSRYSSEGTRSDARRLAESLGIDFREIPIEPMVEAFGAALAPSFAGREPDLTEENLQARDPRDAADGALEQVRLARDRDREQVGAVGRLLDAVRRPRRRLRAAQGRLQDGRLPARRGG